MVRILLECILVILTFYLDCFSEVTSVSASCKRCANGGKLLLPNNIFGHCRCLCSGEFAGPKCQFSVKSKKAEGSSGLWDLLIRLDTLERQMQEKEQPGYLQQEGEMQGLGDKEDNVWLD